MYKIQPLLALTPGRFETRELLKRLTSASRQLAEFKGVAASMPNQGILINTLGLEEAKDSSEIENIVTTHDELFRESRASADIGSPARKEVFRYGQALQIGFHSVRDNGLLTNKTILQMQRELVGNDAGFRKLPGTALKSNNGAVVYTPPQSNAEIVTLMSELEQFINQDELFDADPLIKMALIHHQFESIHPFYDGNGRAGRLINVLYLVRQQLLDIPVLYLSRYILRTKGEYYRLLQSVRDDDAWEAWVAYMLTAVEHTALEGIQTVLAIKTLLMEFKHRIRKEYRFYSQDLINTLFKHPYTKIEYIETDLKVSRVTATKYLNTLVEGGFLDKQRVGRSNYYINTPLYRIFADEMPLPQSG